MSTFASYFVSNGTFNLEPFFTSTSVFVFAPSFASNFKLFYAPFCTIFLCLPVSNVAPLFTPTFSSNFAFFWCLVLHLFHHPIFIFFCLILCPHLHIILCLSSSLNLHVIRNHFLHPIWHSWFHLF